MGCSPGYGVFESLGLQLQYNKVFRRVKAKQYPAPIVRVMAKVPQNRRGFYRR